MNGNGMRQWMNALKLREATLYRGDPTMIDQFDISKTGFMALFGMGIYLTDNATIAADYTLKASGHVILQDEELKSPRDLIIRYLATIIRDKFDWRNVSDAIFYKWHQALMQSPEYEKARYHYDRVEIVTKDYQERMNKERMDTLAKLLKQAKEIFKQEAPNLRIVKDTMGKWALVKNDRDAYVSRFEIPDEYLARCLHAERPMPDDVLALIRTLWLDGRPDSTILDMRDANGDFIPFDRWVQAYNTVGIDHAWREEGDRIVKGHGENPTFDVIRNGTHFGGSWFHREENQRQFIDGMMELGYVGLEYTGGNRVGGHVRGGGGVKHRAFVLWDEAAINRFRVNVEKVSGNDTEIETKIANGVRTTSILYPLGKITPPRT